MGSLRVEFKGGFINLIELVDELEPLCKKHGIVFELAVISKMKEDGL